MNDDYGFLKAVLLLLLAAIIGSVVIFFEWQAYVQAIEVAGGEPNIPAFIGWMLAFGGSR